ncbi:phage shock protein C (PspC) family protein [Methanoculleus thermophilus]|uniref:Phage shock protein C (PspC) family protein n=2 Tax=Methanoculleus thermophilus TaxID=2200 RepID=A0A1G9AST8_9EURY|nr:phage shock protein C (PspC) family protein [Methanoculleus thermophilus]
MSAPGVVMKKLTRSRTDRWIAGICGGIGEYLEIDPNVIRVIWVIFTVVTGFVIGIVIYLLLWLILPESGQVRPTEVLEGT